MAGQPCRRVAILGYSPVASPKASGGRKVDDVLRTLTLLGQAERANGGYILSA